MAKKEYDLEKRKRFAKVLQGSSAFGRQTLYITCPFCNTETECYTWSLAGGGKICPCGAKLTYMDGAIPLKNKIHGND